MSFYSIVLIVAFLFLLLTLIAVGIMLQNQDKNKAFPSQTSPCPDGWGVSDNGSCVQPTTGSNKGPGTIATGTNDIWEADGSDYKPKESATVCDKKAWANENKVHWDGVSNYNSCS
jgi:hypothetical protein